MPRLLLGLLILMMCLAACSGGSASPSPTPVPPTEAPPRLPANTPQGLPPGLSDPNAALPGTIVRIDTSETPDAPTRVPLTLNALSYYQQGGIAGTPLSIILYGDGRLIRDGVERRVDAAAIAEIEAMLNAVDFLSIQGDFQQESLAADLFRYTLTVETPLGSRTLVTEDGVTPPALLALYAALRALSEPA